MPTYDYICGSCNHEFEEITPISNRDDVNCPECGKETKRILSGSPGFVVNGACSPSRSSARASGVNGGRPADSVNMGGGVYGVPRLDKNGKHVKITDVKGASNLPKDMQKLHAKKVEKTAMLRDANRKNLGEI